MPTDNAATSAMPGASKASDVRQILTDDDRKGIRLKQGANMSKKKKQWPLFSENARLKRLQGPGQCFSISDRSASSDYSFHALLTSPAPELDGDLGTVQPSPAGTRKWAIVVSAAGLERLGLKQVLSELEPGQSVSCTVGFSYSGTQITDLMLRRNP